MEEQHTKSPVDHRGFLKAAAGGGAALVGSAQVLNAQSEQAGPAAAQADAPPVVEVLSEDRHGSDFMMDVLKPLGFDYVTINPHSDSGGLQESIINYTGNRSPELITCLHEETAVARKAREHEELRHCPVVRLTARRQVSGATPGWPVSRSREADRNRAVA